MRSISVLGLTCIAGLSGPAAADETVRPDPHSSQLRVEVGHAAYSPGDWGPREGRLSYLHGSPCSRPGGCSLRPAELDVRERDYIKSLDLVTYGSMNLKFTGDRVKLKVRF